MSRIEISCDAAPRDMLSIQATRKSLHIMSLSADDETPTEFYFEDPDKIRALRDACDEALQACSGS